MSGSDVPYQKARLGKISFGIELTILGIHAHTGNDFRHQCLYSHLLWGPVEDKAHHRPLRTIATLRSGNPLATEPFVPKLNATRLAFQRLCATLGCTTSTQKFGCCWERRGRDHRIEGQK